MPVIVAQVKKPLQERNYLNNGARAKILKVRAPKQSVLRNQIAERERAFAFEMQKKLGLSNPKSQLISRNLVSKVKLDCPLAVVQPNFFERLPGGAVYLSNPRLREYVDSALYLHNFRGKDIERIKNIRIEVAKFSQKLDIFFVRHGKGTNVLEKKHRFKEFLKEYRVLLKNFSSKVGDMKSANVFANEVFDTVIPTLRSYGWAPPQLFEKVAPIPFGKIKNSK